MKLSREVAWAAAWDAGTRSAQEGKRVKWSQADYEVACKTFEALFPSPDAPPEPADPSGGPPTPPKTPEGSAGRPAVTGTFKELREMKREALSRNDTMTVGRIDAELRERQRARRRTGQ